MILMWSMSVNVKVLNKWKTPALDDVHDEMNYTKDFRIGQSRGEIDSSNDTMLFLVVAQQTRWES